MAREVGVPQRVDTRDEMKGAEIGAGSAQILKRTLSLATARESVEIQLAGRWLWAVETVGADALLDVFFNDPSGSPVTFKRGLMLQHVAFHRLFVSNAAQPGKSITLHTSMSAIDIANSSPELTGQFDPSPYLAPVHTSVALASGVATLVSAADVDKREVHVMAHIDNTGTVWLGGSNTVSAANGYGALLPFDEKVIPTSGEVWAFSTGAADVVRVLTVKL